MAEIFKELDLDNFMIPEYKFHKERRWRFDFAFPKVKIAFEIEGGIWVGGRHVNPSMFIKDCEKYNEATRMGWKVFRLPPSFLTVEYVRDLMFHLK
jgi:hypothetical protein